MPVWTEVLTQWLNTESPSKPLTQTQIVVGGGGRIPQPG